MTQSINAVWHKRRFARDEAGSIAILFALVGAIVIFSAGMAIDFGRNTTIRAQMQTAADAAALAAAAAYSDGASVVEAKEIANNVFLANSQDIATAVLAELQTPAVQIDTETGDVDVIASVVVPNTLSKIKGDLDSNLEVSASATSRVIRTEVVLAVDQSGSMVGSRQTALEAAMLDFNQIIFEGAEQANDVFVGIVPWQTTVNIGTSRPGWLQGLSAADVTFDPANDPVEDVIQALADIDFDAQGYEGFNPSFDDFADVFDDENINQDDYDDLRWRGCVLMRDIDFIATSGFDIDDFAATSEVDRDTLIPTNVDDLLTRPIGSNRFHIMYQPLNWGIDGNNNNRVNEWRNQFGDGRGNEGPNIGCIRQPMTYLSNLESSLNAATVALDPRDDNGAHTDTSHGMLWGLRMLDPNWSSDWGSTDPDLPSDFGDNEVNKIIVLMTDGANGISGGTIPQSWSAYRDTRETLNAAIDTNSNGDPRRATDALNIRTLRLCELSKQMGVKVYTVGFLVGNNQKVKDMLANCASGPDFSFLVDNGTELSDAFETIAGEIRTIHLTR